MLLCGQEDVCEVLPHVTWCVLHCLPQPERGGERGGGRERARGCSCKHNPSPASSEPAVGMQEAKDCEGCTLGLIIMEHFPVSGTPIATGQ